MQKERIVYVNRDLCAGCELCTAACSVSHYGENNRNLAGISILRDLFERFEIQFMCRHCEEPECVKSCISGAMQKDPETGFVTSDADLCIGCHTCEIVCPYDSVKIVKRPDKKRVAIKCDGCPTLEIPACVQVCPTKALQVAQPAAANI